MERAWSVMREGTLSPYTYYYDHAPAGWLTIAAWVAILPHQFETFGNAINTGRVLMLIVHVASVFLLFQTMGTVPRGGGFHWFGASLAAPGAAVAFAFDGGFRAGFLAGTQDVFRHRNRPISVSCVLPPSPSPGLLAA